MYTQPEALRLTTPLGPDALLLERLEGREAISQPYRLRLAMLAERGTHVPFDKLLGAEVSVSLARPDGPPRCFHGVVHRLAEAEQLAGPRGEATFTRYEAEVVPRLSLLGKNLRSRAFTSRSVPEILMEVLHGLDVDNRVQGRFWPREFVAQYRESDLAFASRLMEEEGIFYFFRHSPQGHQLVLANTPQAHPEVERPGRVIYERVAGGTRPDERVVAWKKTQEIRPGRVTLRDYSLSMPDKDLQASRAIQEAADAGTVAHSLAAGGAAGLESYDYPGRYAQRFDEVGPGGQERPEALPRIFDDGLRTAGIRMQEEAASALVIDGQGGCRQFAAGHAFTLERHRDADGPYVLTEVEHTASVEGAYTRGEPATLSYRNTFRAIPASLPFRPARATPRPMAGGPQTAVVVGPSADDPIFCDKFGRVKVQFRWDREGSRGADSSCWVRVAQPWAGAGWGAIALPRVGQEVVVGFLGGDPDRPLILGGVHNAGQMPPFPLPANKTQAGIKSDSHRSPDPQAFSGLGFEDQDGAEHVHLHSQRHMTHSTEQNFYINAAHGHHQHVGHYSIRQVGGLPFIDHSRTSGSDGGGGGGGGDPTPTPTPTPTPDPTAKSKAGPFSWNPVIMGKAAQDLDMVLGWRRVNTIGMHSTTAVGQSNTTVINPLGLLRMLGPEGGTSAFAKFLTDKPGGFTAPLTGATFTVGIGGVNTMDFGPRINIHRGGAQITQAPQDNDAWAVVTRALSLLYCTAAVADVFLPMMKETYDPTTKSYVQDAAYEDLEMGLAIGVTEIALGLWIYGELNDPSLPFKYAWGKIESACSSIFEGLYIADPPESTNNGPWVKIPRSVPKVHDDSNDIREESSGEEVQSDGVGGDDLSGMRAHFCDSLYAINSPRIALTSVLGLDPTEPSLIAIQALGNEAFDGSVFIQGSGEVLTVGGEQAYIQVKTVEEVEGKITVDCGAAGTITLQSGIEKEPNSLVMAPEGITVASTLKIEAEVDETSITLTPEGITESSAESSLSITPEGITLSVAESSIAITAEGIVITSGPSSIEITAEGIVINGPTLTLTGDEEATITAPEVMIM